MAALVLLAAAGSWALRHRQSASTAPRVVPLTVQPAAPAAPPATPSPKPAGSMATAANSDDTTLRALEAPAPDNRQLRRLLNSWLTTKAAVLAGGEVPAQLDQIAREAAIDRLREERRSDAASGQHKALHVQIADLTLAESAASRIAVHATLRYSDETLDASGRVIRRTPPTELNNAYIFGRDGGRWRLVASRSLN